MRTTSNQGFELIRYFESLHDGDVYKIGLQPKLDPRGIVTCGYGHALKNPKTNEWLTDISDVAKYYPQFSDMTIEDAEDLLQIDVRIFEKIVNSKVQRVIPQFQFDSLVSHTFNTGGSNTLFGLIRNKCSEQEIKYWWTEHYITSNGITLSGLIRRRKSEYELYSTGKLNFFE